MKYHTHGRNENIDKKLRRNMVDLFARNGDFDKLIAGAHENLLDLDFSQVALFTFN
jgi:hypothetical protein